MSPLLSEVRQKTTKMSATYDVRAACMTIVGAGLRALEYESGEQRAVGIRTFELR
jgi:hypothetical protein